MDSFAFTVAFHTGLQFIDSVARLPVLDYAFGPIPFPHAFYRCIGLFYTFDLRLIVDYAHLIFTLLRLRTRFTF